MIKAIRLFGYILFALFLLIGLAVIVMESNPGRLLAQKILVAALKRSGVHVEVGSLKGRIPQEIDLTDVKIQGLAGYDFEIEQLHMQLSLVRLLKRELCIEKLTADGVQIRSGASSTTSDTFPTTLSVESFHLTRVEGLNLDGRLKIKRDFKSGHFNCSITRPDLPEAKAELVAFKRRDGELELHVDLDTPTLSPFKQWIQSDVEGPLQLQLYAKGSLNAYSGKFSGRITPHNLPLVSDRDWVFRGKLHKGKGKNLQLKQMIASTSHLRLKGSLDFDSHFAIDRGRIQLQTDLDQIPNWELQGRLMATAQFERSPAGITGKIDWTIPQFSFLEHVHGTLAGTGSMTNFVGDILVTAQSKKEHWSAKTPVSYRAGEALILSKIELDSPLLKANGDLVRRADGFWVGTGLLDQGNLQLIQRIRPSIELYGQSTGSYNLEVIDLEGTLLQAVQADLSANEIYLGTAYAKEASFSLDWREDVKGQIDALLKGVRYEQLLVETAAFQTASGSENWPFHLTVDGTLRDPLQIALDGAWHYRNGEFALTVQSGSGQMLHYPIALSNPASIEWKQGSFLCRDWRGTVGLAELSFNFDGQPSQTDAELKLDRVPLDFLSLNPLDVAVSGTLSLDAKFKERASRVTGDFNASIESLEVKVPGEVDLLFANGTFAGQFDRERLQLKGGLEVRSTPLLTLDLDLPIHFQLWPFEASFLTHKNSAGHLAMNGRIEDFLDFFNLGPHRLEGECTCDLSLRNTLENPRLEGTCDLANGYYQNYITGTELTNIRAELIAEQEHLTLRSLTAQDAVEKGTLAGSGDLLLSAAENFPFKVDLSFQRLNIAQIDLITAEAEGTVSIRGDWNSATARGDVEVIETDMTIPSRLPRQLPNLQVVYKNAPKPIAHTAPHLISTYPLNLDLNVKAPSGVFIGGRGLHSEWKGDFHLGGTYTALAPKGTLQLLSGDFVFASRTFKLSDGTVTLTGKEREMPFIDISATLSEKGVSITARLRGPLDHPQVTLQSVPPLPLSGILSYLLFGQDLSEIDGVQALQLATTVASMAGEGPDVLENTRKSLGIDRLRIITSPSGGDEATDAIALQVGKYVAKGVIVSVSQGAEDSSTNISIEVDLTRGFFLQAESQQQQEQGKFTLKWNRNY